MCGIVGYVGERPARELLLAGLRKLEYRGYDSAGISVISEGRIDAVRAVGNLGALQAKLEEALAAPAAGALAGAGKPATTRLRPTRWAAPGRGREPNAHPHRDTTELVHEVGD